MLLSGYFDGLQENAGNLSVELADLDLDLNCHTHISLRSLANTQPAAGAMVQMSVHGMSEQLSVQLSEQLLVMVFYMTAAAAAGSVTVG